MNIITAGTRKLVIPNFDPVVPARPRGGAAAASSVDIAKSISGLVWLGDPDDADKSYQDSALTTLATNDGEPVGGIVDASGNSNNFTQATTSKKATLRTGANGINGRRAWEADGTDDILVAPNFLSASQGTVIFVYRLSSPLKDNQDIFCTADEATLNGFLVCRAYRNITNPNILVDEKAYVLSDRVRGSTTLVADTTYIAVWRSNGSEYSFRVNGADETKTVEAGADSGDWWGDIVDRDNVTIFGLKRSDEPTPFKGLVGFGAAFSSFVTGTDLTDLEAALAAEFGVSL